MAQLRARRIGCIEYGASSPDSRHTMTEEWIKTLNDGSRVKFIYCDLPEDGTFITAQLEGNEVVLRNYLSV